MAFTIHCGEKSVVLDETMLATFQKHFAMIFLNEGEISRENLNYCVEYIQLLDKSNTAQSLGAVLSTLLPSKKDSSSTVSPLPGKRPVKRPRDDENASFKSKRVLTSDRRRKEQLEGICHDLYLAAVAGDLGKIKNNIVKVLGTVEKETHKKKILIQVFTGETVATKRRKSLSETTILYHAIKEGAKGKWELLDFLCDEIHKSDKKFSKEKCRSAFLRDVIFSSLSAKEVNCFVNKYQIRHDSTYANAEISKGVTFAESDDDSEILQHACCIDEADFYDSVNKFRLLTHLCDFSPGKTFKKALERFKIDNSPCDNVHSLRFLSLLARHYYSKVPTSVAAEYSDKINKIVTLEVDKSCAPKDLHLFALVNDFRKYKILSDKLNENKPDLTSFIETCPRESNPLVALLNVIDCEHVTNESRAIYGYIMAGEQNGFYARLNADEQQKLQQAFNGQKAEVRLETKIESQPAAVYSDNRHLFFNAPGLGLGGGSSSAVCMSVSCGVVIPMAIRADNKRGQKLSAVLQEDKLKQQSHRPGLG